MQQHLHQKFVRCAEVICVGQCSNKLMNLCRSCNKGIATCAKLNLSLSKPS